jgi:hypothetical protein
MKEPEERNMESYIHEKKLDVVVQVVLISGTGRTLEQQQLSETDL